MILPDLRVVNKTKPLEWCQSSWRMKRIFLKLCSLMKHHDVQLKHPSCICFRIFKTEPRALNQKHPAKVYIWEEFSTKVSLLVNFNGNMNAPKGIRILESSVLPFTVECYPRGHKLH